MGCCSSKENTSNNSTELRSVALESKGESITKENTTTLSQDKTEHTRRNTSTKGMTKLAMQFPYIRKSFKSCKKVFDIKAKEYNNEHPTNILKTDVKSLLIKLGAKESNLTDNEMKRIIEISNLDSDDKIDFKEFLIAAAVGCFLAPGSQNELDKGICTEQFASNRKGFMVAKEAFDFIDADGSGEIDYDELKSAFLAMKTGGSKKKTDEHDQLIETRLKELDFDGDKNIAFAEFVWGITAWVGMDPDGIDDDELNDYDENTTANAGDLMSPRTALQAKKYNENEIENENNNDNDTIPGSNPTD